MADKSMKVAQNVPGKFYVDTSCISCGQCGNTAPDYFVEGPDGFYYVKQQPATPDTIALCQEAMGICPVDAIGDDGEE